jgi:hypothetical protein
VVTIERVALPVAGGIGEQDARDLTALAVIERTMQAVWHETAARARAARRQRAARKDTTRRG